MWNFAALDTTPLNSPLALFSTPCHPQTVKHCKENPLSCHPFPLKLLPTCENIGLQSHLGSRSSQAHSSAPQTHPSLPTPKSHVIPPGPHSPIARKPRNINDLISKPETPSGELRAKLLSTCHGSTSRSPPRGLRGLAAVPEGGGRARASTRAPSPARSEAATWPAGRGRGAGGRRRGQGGPRDRPLRAVRLACGDLAGGPPPTGTHSGPTLQGRPRGGRRSDGQSNAGDLAGPQPQQAAPRAAAAQ